MTRPASTPPSTRKPWSHTDDAMLTEMYQRGMAVTDIAKRLGRTFGGARRRLEVLDVHRNYTLNHRSRKGAMVTQGAMRRWTSDEIEYLKNAHSKNVSIGLIARRLKRGAKAVSSKLRRLGLTYSVYNISMTTSELAALLGIDINAFTYRCRDAINPIPHTLHGRMKNFDYYDVMGWLEAGNILSFDRAKIAPDLHRLYDKWRKNAISSTELRMACTPLYDYMMHRKGADNRIALGPRHEVYYERMAVYALAYERGHTIPPDARGDFVAVRAAWLTEWVHRKDIDVAYGLTMVRYHYRKYFDTAPGDYVRRADLCAVLRKRGMESEVRRWYSVPIPWQELVADYERTKR